MGFSFNKKENILEYLGESDHYDYLACLCYAYRDRDIAQRFRFHLEDSSISYENRLRLQERFHSDRLPPEYPGSVFADATEFESSNNDYSGDGLLAHFLEVLARSKCLIMFCTPGCLDPHTFDNSWIGIELSSFLKAGCTDCVLRASCHHLESLEDEDLPEESCPSECEYEKRSKRFIRYIYEPVDKSNRPLGITYKELSEEEKKMVVDSTKMSMEEAASEVIKILLQLN